MNRNRNQQYWQRRVNYQSQFYHSEANKQLAFVLDKSETLPIIEHGLKNLASSIEMQLSRRQQYEEFKNQIMPAIIQALKGYEVPHGCQIRAFGSLGSQLAIQESDLDLVILIPQNSQLHARNQKINLLRFIQRNLMGNPGTKAILIQAKFPILKIQKENMVIDLSINDSTTILKRLQISANYTQQYKHFKTIYLVLHHLMVKYKLGSNQSGGIGGWALQQMIQVALNLREKQVDNSQNVVRSYRRRSVKVTGNQCVDQLMWVLDLYVNQFNNQRQVIDTAEGRIRSADARDQEIGKDHVIVYDPVVTTSSLVQHGKWTKVQWLFKVVLDNMLTEISKE
eukprot:TRINITY_DN689_c0_g2_i5.p2 TRINITY_DN689_c0_g2~~TRINITY_DN689_c0_g2_i5.p2  ORF type:complete len:339 (-),score=7.56 TRINITY_DN689_c0_g2_i5:3677-4693(-)